MPEGATAPLYEGGDIQRVLITGIDRLDRMAPGLYELVCTVNSSNHGVPERKVVLYLDLTADALAEFLKKGFSMVSAITEGALSPEETSKDESNPKPLH